MLSHVAETARSGDILGDGGTTDVLDAGCPADVHVQTLANVDGDLRGPRRGHRRNATTELGGGVLRGVADRDGLAVDRAGKLRLDVAGGGEVERVGGQIVDDDPARSFSVDPKLIAVELSDFDLTGAGQLDPGQLLDGEVIGDRLACRERAVRSDRQFAIANLGLDSLQHLRFCFDGERFRVALLDQQGADAFERNRLDIAHLPHLATSVIDYWLLDGWCSDTGDDRAVLLGGIVVVPALHNLAAGDLGEGDAADP